jgi:hypothetical protein
MYVLREIRDGDNFKGVEILIGEQVVARLTGGISILVTTHHSFLEKSGLSYFSERQDEFLFGIVTALNHCAMTGKIPSVVDGL